MPGKANTLHFYLVGSINVGKSAVIQQILKGHFTAEHYATPYTLSLPETSLSGHQVTFWDTRGSDSVRLFKLRLPLKRYAVVFVYDVTDHESFQHVKKSLREFQSLGYTCPTILLGNKIDKETKRKVRQEDVQELARSSNSWIESSSATTRQLATAPFDRLLKRTSFFQQLLSDGRYPPRLDGQLPSQASTKRVRGGCFTSPLLWLLELFSSKSKAMSDEVEMPKTPPSTVVTKSESHLDQQSMVKRDYEIDRSPPSRESTLLPAIPPCRPHRTRYPVMGGALQSLPLPIETVAFLVEGETISITSTPISTSGEASISKFFHSDNLYLWIHWPLDLCRLIRGFRAELYWSQLSQTGVCAIEEFWYVINDERATPVFQASLLLRETMEDVFASSLIQKCDSTNYMRCVHESLSWNHPPIWVCRYVWSLFVYARHRPIAYMTNGNVQLGSLADIVPSVTGVNLSVIVGGETISIQVPWTDCVDINSSGIYLDPASQNVVRNLPGWSSVLTEWEEQDIGVTLSSGI